MIKTLKWVYDLGRQHERMRVKRIATEFIQAARFSGEQYDIERMTRPNFPFDDNDDHAQKERKMAKMHKREHQIEIDQAVSRVLEQMIYPDARRGPIIEKPMPPAIDDESL